MTEEAESGRSAGWEQGRSDCGWSSWRGSLGPSPERRRVQIDEGEDGMSLMAQAAPVKAIEYPDSDGLPMADNTKQLRWIVVLYGNLCALFRAVADVFVAGNHLWYPVEGHPEIRNAPDVTVVFGRPKGDRGSYKQWEEGGVPVTVAFEVLSPGNDPFEMADKQAFYDEHGVEEYYLFDPDHNRLAVYVRQGKALRRVWKADGFASPRLGIRFDLSGPEMVVYHPDGRRFCTFEELEADRAEAEQRAELAEREAKQARQEADTARREAEQTQQRLARLRELSRKARQQQAGPEELQELERLEDEATR
jgi:Uma2 family endonuclease